MLTIFAPSTKSNFISFRVNSLTSSESHSLSNSFHFTIRISHIDNSRNSFTIFRDSVWNSRVRNISSRIFTLRRYDNSIYSPRRRESLDSFRRKSLKSMLTIFAPSTKSNRISFRVNSLISSESHSLSNSFHFTIRISHIDNSRNSFTIFRDSIWDSRVRNCYFYRRVIWSNLPKTSFGIIRRVSFNNRSRYSGICFCSTPCSRESYYFVSYLIISDFTRKRLIIGSDFINGSFISSPTIVDYLF